MITNVELSASGVEKFDAFFEHYARDGVRKQAVLSEVLDSMQDRASGGESLTYELSPQYTRSGNPALLDLGREDIALTEVPNDGECLGIVGSTYEILSLGSVAELVEYKDGSYRRIDATGQESWQDVIHAVDLAEASVAIEPLVGQGEFTHAAHIVGPSLNCVYFVAP